MTEKETQRFTVFTATARFLCNASSGKWDVGLDALIEMGVEKFGTPYVCWAPEFPNVHGGKKARQDLFAESIAAGRTIEKVGDRWVARGGEAAEEYSPTVAYIRSLARAELRGKPAPAKAEAPTDPTRPPLDWAKPASTDRFPGYIVRGSGERNEPSAGHFGKQVSPDIGTSHQVSPMWGSAELGG